ETQCGRLIRRSRVRIPAGSLVLWRCRLMGAIRTGTGMLVIGLFLTGGTVSAGDKDAKALFDQMEKKLAEAATIRVTVNGKLKGGAEEGTIKATLLIAQGNKVRADISVETGGKARKSVMVSNGTKQKSGVPGKPFQDKDTPKHLRDNLVYT